MSVDLRDSIDRYLDAQDIDVISRESRERLSLFLSLVDSYHSKLNLVSYRNYDELISKHLIDGVLAVKPLPETGNFCDIGSGAGFPGIVFAVLRPQISFVLCESNGTKAHFLNEAVRGMGLANTTIQGADYHLLDDSYDGLTFRGFAGLGTLLKIGKKHLNSGGAVYALKGPGYEEELGSISAKIREGFNLPEIHAYALPCNCGHRVMVIHRKKQVCRSY